MEVSVPELWAHCPSKQLLAQNQRSLRPLQVYPFQQASEGQSRLTFTPAGVVPTRTAPPFNHID